MSKIHPPKAADPQRIEPPTEPSDDPWDQALAGEIGLAQCVRTGASEYFCHATEQRDRTYQVVWSGAAVLMNPSDSDHCWVTNAGKRFASNCTEVTLSKASRSELAKAHQRSDFYYQSALRVLRWTQQHGDYRIEQRSQDPTAKKDVHYVVSDSGHEISFVLRKETRRGRINYQLKMDGIETFLNVSHGRILEKLLAKITRK